MQLNPRQPGRELFGRETDSYKLLDLAQISGGLHEYNNYHLRAASY